MGSGGGGRPSVAGCGGVADGGRGGVPGRHGEEGVPGRRVGRRLRRDRDRPVARGGRGPTGQGAGGAPDRERPAAGWREAAGADCRRRCNPGGIGRSVRHPAAGIHPACGAADRDSRAPGHAVDRHGPLAHRRRAGRGGGGAGIPPRGGRGRPPADRSRGQPLARRVQHADAVPGTAHTCVERTARPSLGVDPVSGALGRRSLDQHLAAYGPGTYPRRSLGGGCRSGSCQRAAVSRRQRRIVRGVRNRHLPSARTGSDAGGQRTPHGLPDVQHGGRRRHVGRDVGGAAPAGGGWRISHAAAFIPNGGERRAEHGGRAGGQDGTSVVRQP
jgi:hypothetical protein